MTISFDVPSEIEPDLRTAIGNLSESAKHAFVIENYRLGRISLGTVTRLVGLETTIEAQRWLAERAVGLNYAASDLADDRRTLGRLFPSEPAQ